MSLGFAAFLLVLTALVGCAGGARAVPPEELARAAEALERPFAVERNVVTDRLEIVATSNFYDRLTLPGAQPTRSTSPEGHDVYDYRTDLRQPLDVAIGATRFKVLDRVRVVVLTGRSELTLSATAEGKVTVLAADRSRRDLRLLQIAGGEVREE